MTEAESSLSSFFFRFLLPRRYPFWSGGNTASRGKRSSNKHQTWEEIEKELRVYYEILDPSQFLSFEPATKIGLYAYHPLTPTDESAFDDIKLDVDAYEFIENNIKIRKPAPSYLGL